MFSKKTLNSFIIAFSVPLLLSAEEKSIYKNQMVEGFSEPSRFETRGDSYFSFYAFFNEFAANQDGNEIAYQGMKDDSFYPASNIPEGNVYRFDNEYHPGFQVGLRFNLPIDKWIIGADYFWYRGENSKSKVAIENEYFISPVFFSNFSNPLSNFKSNWKLSMDLGDIYLSRPFYSGRCLTVEPKLGLKVASIRENYDINATLVSGSYTSQDAWTSSKMYGIGPIAGARTNFLIGKGFAVLGDLFASLLYSRYTENEATFKTSSNISSTIKDSLYATVRPIADASIGLEWKGSFGVGTSSYTWHKSFYMSVFATYNFSLFFSQNVSRSLVSVAAGDGISPGNLYLQGVSVGLDFIF